MNTTRTAVMRKIVDREMASWSAPPPKAARPYPIWYAAMSQPAASSTMPGNDDSP